MNDIVISGINLMLTGMITVFIFLATLILLINIVASLFENDITKGSIDIDIPKTQATNIEEHKKIIKLIQKRIFNE
jgi:Na+-transporting methylmalonyl-CoA/oxaloacetate decarboxylase gamma subunit